MTQKLKNKIEALYNACPTCKIPMGFNKSGFEQYQPSTYDCSKCGCQIQAYKMHDRNSGITDVLSLLGSQENLISEEDILNTILTFEDGRIEVGNYVHKDEFCNLARAILQLIKE